MNCVLSFPDARRLVEQQARNLKPPVVETVALLESRERVLAEAITADRDFPPFDRATRDGYAVRSADALQIPAVLKIIGEIKAGASPESGRIRFQPGEACAIMTGAPLPQGADSVVMVEHTSRAGDRVELHRATVQGENVVPRAAEARAGDNLLHPGTLLNEAGIALAASAGKSELKVFAKPQVAIMATGDELVDVDSQPGPNEIRNSNSYSLAAQVLSAGGCPLILPRVRDEAAALQSAIGQGFTADLLLIAGGVSMGKYDLVEDVLQQFGAKFFFTGVLIQPGKPVVFGVAPPPAAAKLPKAALGVPPSPTCRDFASLKMAAEDGGATLTTHNSQLFFGLPGNPLSTMVTFDLFARPVIHALAGRTPQPLIFLKANLRPEMRVRTGLTRFLPAILSGEFEISEVAPVEWRGSGDISAAARANCYVVLPPNREHFQAGETVSIMVKPA